MSDQAAHLQILLTEQAAKALDMSVGEFVSKYAMLRCHCNRPNCKGFEAVLNTPEHVNNFLAKQQELLNARRDPQHNPLDQRQREG